MKEFEVSNSTISLVFDSHEASTCVMSIQPLTPLVELTLTFSQPVLSITLHGKVLEHTTTASALLIHLGEEQSSSKIFTLTLTFNLTLLDSALLSRDNMHLWFPCCLDDKYTMEWQLCIKSHDEDNSPMVAICVGDLVGRYAHPTDRKRVIYRYTFRTPISPKSVVITIGSYKALTMTGSGAAVGSGEENGRVKMFYSDKLKKESVVMTCSLVSQMLEFVEQWVGASYPFGCLKIVFADCSYLPVVSGATVIVVSSSLIVDENVIDQVFSSRFGICAAVAYQWFGHYIATTSMDDVWITVGFSRWIAYQFMKKIQGENEIKFRMKKDMERICLLDVKQPPICPMNLPKTKSDLLVGHDFNPFEDSNSLRAELLCLKSALVLYMMEKRFGKGLLQKLASKILITQMSGELSSGLGTLSFLKIARKISGKVEIKEFADQWIFKSGSPIITTTYSFNRKKMVIEVRIKQRSSNEGMVGANPKFTGPFVIRVQEPAGTFDTEIRVEEYQKQYDIIYHTKYKRIRRGAPKKSRQRDDDDDEEEVEEEETVETSEMFVEPDRITFEWIRQDPDSMWVCHKTFEQDDFMWNSLLRQDKDIVGQYEAIVALGKIPSVATCATLTTVVSDKGFFYRLRMEAAKALVKFDTKELDFMGLNSLLAYFKSYTFGTFKGQVVQKRNKFDDLKEYYIYCAIIVAMTKFRDENGFGPAVVREALIELIRMNDNTCNDFSDSNLISICLDCLGNSFLSRSKNSDNLVLLLQDRVNFKVERELKSEDVEEFDFPTEQRKFDINNSDTYKNYFGPKDLELLKKAEEMIMRMLIRDRFAGSFMNSITVTCLEVLSKWQVAGLIESNIAIFLSYSRFGHYRMIRRVAIEGLLLVTGLKESALTSYLSCIAVKDKDPMIRYSTSISLMSFIALACHQVEVSQNSVLRRKVLTDQVDVMIKVFDSATVDTFTARYIDKIKELGRDVIPVEKTKLKFKLPFASQNSLASIEAPVATERAERAEKGASKKKVKVELDRCRKLLRKVMSQQTSFWFRNAVDPVALGIPQYFEIVKKPMDLGLVKRKLEKNEYATEEDFADEVRLVFENSFLFNPPESQVNIDAKALLALFEHDFNPTKAPKPVKVAAAKPVKVAAKRDEMEIAQKLFDKLRESTHSAIFQYPVDGEMYPDYYITVKTPIDLQAIQKKISTRVYLSLQDFHEDILLLITNCFLFNKKGTFGYAAGDALQSLYIRISRPFVKYLQVESVLKPANQKVKRVVPAIVPLIVPDSTTRKPFNLKVRLRNPSSLRESVTATDVDMEKVAEVKVESDVKPMKRLVLKLKPRLVVKLVESPIALDTPPIIDATTVNMTNGTTDQIAVESIVGGGDEMDVDVPEIPVPTVEPLVPVILPVVAPVVVPVVATMQKSDIQVQPGMANNGEVVKERPKIKLKFRMKMKDQ